MSNARPEDIQRTKFSVWFIVAIVGWVPLGVLVFTPLVIYGVENQALAGTYIIFVGGPVAVVWVNASERIADALLNQGVSR